jgi:hypothetical protein
MKKRNITNSSAFKKYETKIENQVLSNNRTKEEADY